MQSVLLWDLFVLPDCLLGLGWVLPGADNDRSSRDYDARQTWKKQPRGPKGFNTRLHLHLRSLWALAGTWKTMGEDDQKHRGIQLLNWDIDIKAQVPADITGEVCLAVFWWLCRTNCIECHQQIRCYFLSQNYTVNMKLFHCQWDFPSLLWEGLY